jgi:hypothetical protein
MGRRAKRIQGVRTAHHVVLEVFTVATSPIVAFLATLGPVGLALIGRYFQMLVWIALWGPVMAVCNLYITIVTSRALGILATQAETNGATLASMSMHDLFYATLENWIATGGMLSASVPALSLMLVYGGSSAASHIAGKLGSDISSKMKPERLAPEPISIDSPVKISSTDEFNANTGGSKAGYDQPSYNFSSTTQKARQSATSTLTSASNTAAQLTTSAAQSAIKSGHTSSAGTSLTDLAESSRNVSDQVTGGIARTLGEQYGRNEREKEAIEAQATMALGASLKGSPVVKALALKAAVNGALASTSGVDAATERGISDSQAQTFAKQHAEEVASRTSHQTASQAQEQGIFGSEEMQSLGAQHSEQLQRINQSSEEYSESTAQNEQSGKFGSDKYSSLAAKLNKNAGPELANYEREIGVEGGKKLEQYNQAKKNAQKEIDTHGLELGQDNNEALVRYLAIDATHPGVAADIGWEALYPSSQRTGVLMEPGKFAEGTKGVDGIVSGDKADDFRQKSSIMPVAKEQGGNDSRYAARNRLGQSKNYGQPIGVGFGEDLSLDANQLADYERSTKEGGGERQAQYSQAKKNAFKEIDGDGITDDPVDRENMARYLAFQATNTGIAAGNGVDGNVNTLRQGDGTTGAVNGDYQSDFAKEVESALSGSDELGNPSTFRKKTQNGPLLHNVDANRLVERSLDLEGDAAASAAKPLVDDFSKNWEVSKDEFERLFGNSDKGRSNDDLPPFPSDNDLPPILKD